MKQFIFSCNFPFLLLPPADVLSGGIRESLIPSRIAPLYHHHPGVIFLTSIFRNDAFPNILWNFHLNIKVDKDSLFWCWFDMTGLWTQKCTNEYWELFYVGLHFCINSYFINSMFFDKNFPCNSIYLENEISLTCFFTFNNNIVRRSF